MPGIAVDGVYGSESACQSTGHNIELHDVLNKPYIHVTHDGQTRQYAKSEIYGFRTCENRDYRFVGSRFNDAPDQTFREDANLTQYDEFHKMFKVNRLLIAAAVTDQ